MVVPPREPSFGSVGVTAGFLTAHIFLTADVPIDGLFTLSQLSLGREACLPSGRLGLLESWGSLKCWVWA